MAQLPSGIIFINKDMNDILQDKILLQLFIDEHMTGEEFDARLATDPNYVDIVHLEGLRILVIRSLREQTNREFADVVIFVKSGLAAVLKNNWGPPGLTLPVDNFYIYQLLREVGKIA